MTHSEKIIFLCTSIGRGHPFYLDGIIDQVKALPTPPQVHVSDVFEISQGLSRQAWKAVRWMYHQGASEGFRGKLYAGLREGTKRGPYAVAISLLGRDLRREFIHGANTLVVAHPLLVEVLRGRKNLIYQHGELVVPPQALALGASVVLVPTEEAAGVFARAGYAPEQVFVSGLCIESAIASVAEEAYQNRLARGQEQAPLTGLFVSSGAEPAQHIKTIMSSVTSCVRSGIRTYILARKGGRLERALRAESRSGCLTFLEGGTASLPNGETAICELGLFRSRSEENAIVAQWFPRIDFFVGPPHERTNWAVGLGLPLFALTPTFGPFAPLNLQLLEASGTTRVILTDQHAHHFGETVIELQRSGALADMASHGWGRHEINGFERIAHLLGSRSGY